MKNKKGFTLIEVISVLIILSLLATIVVVQYATTIKESRKRLNEEQKSRLIEVAKNISLNNKECLKIAKENPNEGTMITLNQMRKNGYIANNDLKDLEENTLLNSCVIIKWDNEYEKFNYEYSIECTTPKTCNITAETEKVIVSSFYMEEGNINYTNKREVTYYLKYSASINAEYCVTFDNEASCNWKKLDPNSTSISGTLTLKDIENIAHLYIRNSNKNIISVIDDTIIYDVEPPVCTWKTSSKSFINNGSSLEIVLTCNDISGIRNTELLSSAINISNPSLVEISDAVVTTNGTNKDFKFTVYGKSGDGETKLSLKPSVISDNSGNFVIVEKSSSNITVDNIAPNGDVTIGNTNSRYTNTERIILNFSNVSSDVDKLCVSNSSAGNCTYVNYTPTYNWVLSSNEGAKTIYVSFMDKSGNVSSKTVTIYLDKTPPTCRAETTSNNFYLKNGSFIDYVVKCSDTNKIDDTEITSSMLLLDKRGEFDVSYEVLSSTSEGTKIRITAGSGDGLAILSLKDGSIFDAAGNANLRSLITDGVNVDNTPPTNNHIKINYNSTITNLRFVNVQIDSELKNQGGYYCLKTSDNVNSCSNSDWKQYSSSGNIQIGSTVGTHSVYAFFKDLAGNVSPSAATSSIKYNPSAVVCNIVEDGELLKVTSSYANLAALPYSVDGIEWTNNNILIKNENKKEYFSYIKDGNGETNYCTYSIDE